MQYKDTLVQDITSFAIKPKVVSYLVQMTH